MLRMALLGLVILLSAGVLSAMELTAPPRRAAANVQPFAQRAAGDFAAHEALAKADRLDLAAPSSAMPAQTAPVEDRVAPPDVPHIGTPKPEAVVRHRHAPKDMAATERSKPKPKSKPVAVKRPGDVQRSRIASDSGFCRLDAFGGLRKALNLTGCDI